MKRPSRGARVCLACCLAGIALLLLAGLALAEDPPADDGSGSPDPLPAPGPSITNEHNTYNTFQFPLLGDVLKAVFGGINEETKKAAQPGFDALNFTLKTPSLASDGESIGGQLNFNAIVEPMWWAVLPVAGVLGFILLLLSGIHMQAGAISGQPRSVGQGMQGVVSVIVGLALAFFSLQLVHYANEGTNLLVDAIMGAGGPDSGRGLSLAAMAINMIDRVGDVSVLASIIVAIVLLIGALVLVAMAVARWALFFICVVLAPLALVAVGSRATGALTSLWGQLFMMVLLLGPANAIMLRSAQGLYAVAIEGGAFGLNSMAKGAVMFGLISMMGAINGMAIQRAFGVAMGWAKAGVGAVTSGALLAGGATAAVMAGGSLGASGASSRGAGGLALSRGLSPAGGAGGGANPSAAGNPSGLTSANGYLGAQPPLASAGTEPEAEHENEDSAGWGERFKQRRQAFDWGRAALVGGAVAGMAGGPVGRAGMAVQRLGMASTVDKRYRDGRAEREEGRAESLGWRQETRDRADLRDLSFQRQQMYGHPSGPDEVEVANAMDRAVHNVYENSGGDAEGITKGLLSLGKEASARSTMAGSLYNEVGAMSSGTNVGREEAVERFVGARLESAMASRGSLAGPPRYSSVHEGHGGDSPAPHYESGVPSIQHQGTSQGEGTEWNDFAGVPYGPLNEASGGAQPPVTQNSAGSGPPIQATAQVSASQAGGKMSNQATTGSQPSPDGNPTEPVQGWSSAGPSPSSIENNEVFDRTMGRTIGERLGVYDGKDWVGPTPEARQQMGEQMVEQATRLREADRMVEGLTMAIEIGKEYPMEPDEALSRFKSGVSSLGPGQAAAETPAPQGPSQGTQSAAPGVPPKSNPQQTYHETPPADQPDSMPPDSSEQGAQLGFGGWEMADPDNQEG